ncbi:polymer-forming cytoskeletal protein [Bacillus sp. MUM 13]|uniref:polymer-forming cytoskeletal protein n=1 Tax=Bacillus sp. MUM 13 TaxID=1678001 RepID=UPI0008F5E4DA|nr:polymer-forming cytoskeletal protein [Bacillus sp. MUM 13]OIK09337.1 hypothetical protein BIV59_17215 [Bacillus sp. MUM 13]
METGISNLTINGSGSYGGGLYRKVKVNGEASVTDHLECQAFKIMGRSKVEGNTKAETLSVYGEAELNGDLKAEKVKIYGSCQIQGDAVIKESKVRGSLDINGSYQGEQIEVKGGFTVRGDVEAEVFNSQGQFQIDGLLNAEEVNVSLRYDHSFAGEIGGERISIRAKGGLGEMLQLKKSMLQMKASIIEGDEIYLEYTAAEVVRGRNIEIGPGCEINIIEHQGIYKKSKDSIVHEERKS